MRASNLFFEKEPVGSALLASFNPDSLRKIGLLKTVYSFSHYHDEPKTHKYKAVINSVAGRSAGIDYPTSASGYSFFSKRKALLKCLGEATERYCIKVYKNDYLTYASYDQLRRAMDPKSAVSFSSRQKKNHDFRIFNFDDNTVFGWTKGYSLTANHALFVPAQLAFLSYRHRSGEKMIRFPLSSGSAGGGCMAAAISRGIYELVERDGFVIHYLNKLSYQKIDLYSIGDEKLKYILGYLKRYLLEIHTVDITTDLYIPTFATIVVDKTGVGPAVSVGLKSRLNFIEGIIGSIEESLNAREWIRSEYENNQQDISKINSSNMKNLTERGLYWYPKHRLKELKFFLNQKPTTANYESLKLSAGSELKLLLSLFKKKKYEIAYVDLTLPELKKINYHVAMVIIPQLQPLFLKEKYPYLGGDRLYSVPKTMGLKQQFTNEQSLNRVPHPFL